MRFTAAEFDTMVYELLYAETTSFETLCRIAEKTLRSSVLRWCSAEDSLRGRGLEEDLMQDILLRLMNTTVPYFLLRNGVGSPCNNDPEGFEDWMFRVAENLKRDFANRVRNRDFRTEDIERLPERPVPEDGDYDREERIDRLKQALSTVLGANAGIYKVLTWLAQLIFILDQDVTKKQSNELILAAFEQKTLYEMYDMLLVASKRIPWLSIDPLQNERIISALREKRAGGVSYGETKYKEFFMKRDGEVCGKKSISDWVNRLNCVIRKGMDHKPGGPKKKRGGSAPDNQ